MENNPVAVIATHQRMGITKKNIDLILAQGAKVVVVATDQKEVKWFQGRYAKKPVFVCQEDNEPLGAKWQFGVNYARHLNPSHVIINGSDDILSATYIQTACAMNLDAIGLQRWFVLDPIKNELHHFKYLPAQPVGGGRCYGRKFLEDINFELFGRTAKKWLDDLGWSKTIGYNCLQYDGYEGMSILAVKGPWDVINRLEKHFGHKNVEHLKTYTGAECDRILKNYFNYR